MLQADSQNKNFYSNQDLNYVTTATNLLAFLKTKLGGLVTSFHYFMFPVHNRIPLVGIQNNGPQKVLVLTDI